MKPIYPDMPWYTAISERKGLTGRCPFASVHRCPRHFQSVALLSDAGTTTKLPQEVHDRLLANWATHDAWPANAETATAVTFGDEVAQSYSNFCPEVAFEIFGMFASSLVRHTDEVDRAAAEGAIAADGPSNGKDWRWTWAHVGPVHYSECSVYANLHEGKAMAQINFNGPVSGQVNVAGHSIQSPALQLSIGELLARIDAADVPPAEKEVAKSKLKEFLTHPLLASIIGGVAGGAVGLIK